jgi:septum site-determining protein MinC
MDTSSKIQVKGINEGLLVTLGEGDWEDLQNQLLLQIDKQIEFLRGGRLILNVGKLVLNASELGQLRDEISERQLILIAVLCETPTTEQTARTLGLETQLEKPRKETDVTAPDTKLYEGEDTVLVKRTLRSGYSLHHAGHIVIIGDVNPGAEIIAGGNVLVWGHLRGTVHAGAGGNEDAQVCALDLSPVQLRIAGGIATTPKRRGKPQPETAHLMNGQVVAEPWDPKREKV